MPVARIVCESGATPTIGQPAIREVVFPSSLTLRVGPFSQYARLDQKRDYLLHRLPSHGYAFVSGRAIGEHLWEFQPAAVPKVILEVQDDLVLAHEPLSF